MHILISPNAFKNCLDANAAAMAILQGLQESKLSFTYQLLPVGDGGDGTCALIVQQCGGSMVTAIVKDPLMRDIQTSFGWMEERQTAVIEMAAASGLHCLAAYELDPLQASSFGTGELILKALDKGAKHIILCLGGSATVDGGTGMLRALGVRFLDMDGLELTELPLQLPELVKIDTSGLDPRIASCKISLLCDVKNPLLEDSGAAAVFGPQKGATKEAVTLLETALTALNKVCILQLGKDLNSVQYGGTAGGAAAGLHAFLGAQLLNGIDYFLELTGFEKALQHCTLVITGEGGIDTQTLQGKAPFGVASYAKKNGIKVIALAGKIPLEPGSDFYEYFDILMAIGNEPKDLPAALNDTALNLKRTATAVGNLLHLQQQQTGSIH